VTTQPFLEKVHFYYNQQGMMVLTEQYHLERGYCCGNGCLHCPFEYDCVPEPRRSFLLAEKASNAATSTS
jgi:hypothetical protein